MIRRRVVLLQVAARAIVQPEWLESEKVRANAARLAAILGKAL
jgi:hypothetical protein